MPSLTSHCLMRAALALCVALAAVAPARAQGVHSLSDLNLPGEWKPWQWNKTPVELSVRPEFPEAVATQPGEPREALCVAIHWPDDQYRSLSLEPAVKPSPIPYRVLEAGIWVRGAGSAHTLDLRFADAGGKEVRLGLGSLAFEGWRRLAGPIPTEWAQPLTLRSLAISTTGSRRAGDTTLHLTRLEIAVDDGKPLGPVDVKPLAAVDTRPRFTAQAAAEDGLVPDAPQARVYLRLESWEAQPRRLEVRHTLTDWSGRETQLPPLTAELKGSWSRVVGLAVPAYGPYTYRAELRDASGAVLERVQRRLVRAAPVPMLSAAERAGSSIGVNTHYGARWRTLARCGVHWARDYCWGWIAGAASAPSAKGIDFMGIWRAADAAGVTILPTAQQAFRNQAGTAFITDEARIRDAYTRLGRVFPDVPYWELDNEAEYRFPGRRFDMPNYRGYIRAAAAGLRASGKAKIVLNGTAGIRYEDARELLASPEAADFAVVNSHYYTGTLPPELAKEDSNVGGSERRESITFLDQLRRINRLAHDAKKETWLTEIGWDATNGPAVGERLQAIYLPRVYLLSRWCGTDKVFWYFDRDVANSVTRFSTCGILDLENQARPCAAALAALSRHTARAEMAGSVDLGEDRWCLLLKRHEGGWVAAAWSVAKEWPPPKELAGAVRPPQPPQPLGGSGGAGSRTRTPPTVGGAGGAGPLAAYDLFGNQVRPATLTPEIAYFHLERLPEAWEAQRRVEWASPTILSSLPGGEVAVAITDPGGSAAAAWEALPKGIAGRPWTREGDRLVSRIVCAPDLAPGAYALPAVARGAGWQRRWQPDLAVSPALKVSSDAFLPGAPARLQVEVNGTAPAEVAAAAPAAQGRVQPASVAAAPGQPASLEFAPAAGVTVPVPVALSIPSGAGQVCWMRPGSIEVPRATGLRLDGRLDDWPAAGILSPEHFAGDAPGFAVQARFAWSDEGLWLAARIPAKAPRQESPREFWDATNVELLVNPSSEGQEGWPATAHQFWLAPVREDAGWRLYAGEWKRGPAIPATLYDDGRVRTALRQDAGGFTLEALLPREALDGKAPAAGGAWRVVILVQAADGPETHGAGWPYAKGSRALSGSTRWGVLRFVPAAGG